MILQEMSISLRWFIVLLISEIIIVFNEFLDCFLFPENCFIAENISFYELIMPLLFITLFLFIVIIVFIFILKIITRFLLKYGISINYISISIVGTIIGILCGVVLYGFYLREIIRLGGVGLIISIIAHFFSIINNKKASIKINK